MGRLDTDRQRLLEPKRMEFAKSQIERLGYAVTHLSSTELNFEFEGRTVRFFPYSGWHSGATIKDGRGLDNLLKQITPNIMSKTTEYIIANDIQLCPEIDDSESINIVEKEILAAMDYERTVKLGFPASDLNEADYVK